jgi:NAD(P)H-dependent flavin oxidoreductase YrpB (nitropropane dioxygenase family)
MVRWAPAPAGVVFERLPQTRFDALLRAEGKRWRRSPVPVLLTLRGTPDELAAMVAQLEEVEGVAGLVLLAAGQATVEAVATVRALTTLPLLPVVGHGAQISNDAPAAVAAGADALVLCSYPLGIAQAGEELISGLTVGPALLPWTLRALQQAKRAVEVPLIAWGGVGDAAAAQACLAAGASAVMVDGALYGDPFAAGRVALVLATT